jgi:hypothetical protein
MLVKEQGGKQQTQPVTIHPCLPASTSLPDQRSIEDWFTPSIFYIFRMNSQLYQPAMLLQYAAILAAIYVFLNGPFSGVSQGQSTSDESYDIPLSQEKADQLVYPDPNLQCDAHPYNVHIFSRSPLVIYIPNFISKVESEHIISIR